jgi:hypothetical protein
LSTRINRFPTKECIPSLIASVGAVENALSVTTRRRAWNPWRSRVVFQSSSKIVRVVDATKGVSNVFELRSAQHDAAPPAYQIEGFVTASSASAIYQRRHDQQYAIGTDAELGDRCGSIIKSLRITEQTARAS